MIFLQNECKVYLKEIFGTNVLRTKFRKMFGDIENEDSFRQRMDYTNKNILGLY